MLPAAENARPRPPPEAWKLAEMRHGTEIERSALITETAAADVARERDIAEEEEEAQRHRG